MRYIKLFENMKYEPNRYWKVRTDEPYFSISLDKLDVTPKDRFDGIIDSHPSYEHVFIFACDKFGEKWEYNFYDGDDHQRLNSNEKYMGEVKITRNDLKNWKMKKEAEKYNL